VKIDRDLATRLDECLAEALAEVDETGRTVGEQIVMAVVAKALAGDVEAARLIWDRTDGFERRETWK